MTQIFHEMWGLIKANFSNTLLIGILGFIIQRYYKLKDEYKSEKNKHHAEYFVKSCNELFELIVEIKSLFLISQDQLVFFSTRIKELALKNYLYLSDEIIKICHEYSDYLLEISENDRVRDLKFENNIIDKFKKEFRK